MKSALYGSSLALILSSPSLPAYDLFHPVPEAEMRELSADRPDTTESPVTVDAGHIQVEASLFDWRRNGRNDTYTAMATNFKIGLTDSTDLQFVFDSYAWENNAGPLGDSEGFGDVTVRYKWNLWGNDGGSTAFALFPFVKVPTGTALSNDEWEGGLIVPFSMDLREGLGLGLMAELDYVADDQGGHDFEFVHSAVLGFDLTEKWGCFAEYVGVLGEDRYEAYVTGGLTYSLGANVMLDCGAQLGLNDDAEDIGAFTGFTVRF